MRKNSMSHTRLSSYMGLVIVGVTATAALLLETRLDVSEDEHFLLQLLWVGVALGALFLATLQPVLRMHAPAESPDIEEVPEWHDADRAWMQQHPHTLYLADDMDKEEA
jgi:hypothetical protein